MPKYLRITAIVTLMAIAFLCGGLSVTLYVVSADRSLIGAVALSMSLAGGVFGVAGAILFSVRQANATRAIYRVHGQKLDETRTAVLSAIEAERSKESRHEYHQEVALQRIEERLSRIEVSQRAHQVRADAKHLYQDLKVDVLFVTSNGAGMGHVTRAIAISQQVSENLNCAILTLSSAYDRVRGFAIPIFYYPSADKVAANNASWNNQFRNFFVSLLCSIEPKLVVFDGVTIYGGITEACRTLGIPLVWLQRGCWRKEKDDPSGVRHNAQRVCDYVLVPGDYACMETVDVGSNIEVRHVGPIVLFSEDEVLSKKDALRSLKLDVNSRYILVNLGGSLIGDINLFIRSLLSLRNEVKPQWEIVVLNSPLYSKDLFLNGVICIEEYPIANKLAAFDIVVAAAGYNAVQEIAVARVPSVLVPNTHTVTDDQRRRARNAFEAGWALYAESAVEVKDQVLSLMVDEDKRSRLKSRLCELQVATGARESADEIELLVERFCRSKELPQVLVRGYAPSKEGD